MTNSELIWEYQRRIVEIYKNEDLTCLSGFDNTYQLNGKNILVWHSDVTRKCAVKYGGHFDYFQNFDDLVFCSQELMYFTAHLFLYRPFLNDPLKDGHLFYGKMIYPNNQNMEAVRYSMYADVVSERAYNYWDRIGDLIASFFPGSLEQHKIFFPTAIQAIPTEFHNSANYQWLKDFKEGEYIRLNEQRKEIVHYTTTATKFKQQHLEKVSDKTGMEKLLADRMNIADFYKEHINLTLLGFEKTLSFMEEISPTLFP